MSNDARPVFELQGDDGRLYRCQVVEMFELEDQQYALLVQLATDEHMANLVVLRLVERDGAAVFQTIVDDAEFERVAAYLEARAEEDAWSEENEFDFPE
jgi:hypothetical protein